MLRRTFLSHSLKALVLVPASSFLASVASWANDIGKLVPLTDPIAKALKYTHDASKAPERTLERMGVAAKDQTCQNCALYTKAGEIDKEEVGKCTMIQGGLVKAGGWCNSWAKKA